MSLLSPLDASGTHAPIVQGKMSPPKVPWMKSLLAEN